jgi:hypothetical protein
MLMDICSKIFSSVMNGQAFRLLEIHGNKFQFGGTPGLDCQDGLFTLKTLFNAHKKYHLPSFVAFVDLVKAYDTANHDLLLHILEKYGTPPKFVTSIHTMYIDLVVVPKTKKEIWEILQSLGVCQGDNMAPVLFLFLLSAAAETLEVKWHEAGIAALKVVHMHNDELESGCVRGLTPRMYNSTKLTAFEIFQLLYVDDGLFPFPDCNALIAGINLVYSHFAQFGLKILIRRAEDPSKTECIFSTPPSFSTTTMIDPPHDSTKALLPMIHGYYILPHLQLWNRLYAPMCGSQRLLALLGKMPSMMPSQKMQRLMSPMALSPSCAHSNISAQRSLTASAMMMTLKPDLPLHHSPWAHSRRCGGIIILTHTVSTYSFVQSR